MPAGDLGHDLDHWAYSNAKLYGDINHLRNDDEPEALLAARRLPTAIEDIVAVSSSRFAALHSEGLMEHTQ